MVYHADENRYQTIEYRRCGQSGLKLPIVSLGLWHNFGDTTQVENSRALLQRAFDLGINHFDLANNYGPPPGSAERNPQKRATPCGKVPTVTGVHANI